MTVASISLPHLLRPIAISFGLLLLTVLVCGCSVAVLMSGGATPAPTDIAAQRPEATLTIAQPPAGATLHSGKVTVVANYNGPALVAPAQATELNQYHLHYLLDVDPSLFLRKNVPIPLGNPSIIHTANTQVSFENVAPGSHRLAVVLTGSNHVSPTKPVAQEISFVVRD